MGLIAFENSFREGQAVWINPQHVVCVREAANEHAVITLSDGSEITVAESVVNVVQVLTGEGS